MKNVSFVRTLDNIDADTLILCDEEVERDIDRCLNGAITFNLMRSSRPLWMTTNGAYSIPKLAIIDTVDHLELLAVDRRVAIAIDTVATEELAFSLLKKEPQAKQLIFLCDDPEETERRFHKYEQMLHGISLAKEIIASPANLMTPDDVAKRCQQLIKQGVLVNVLDENDLQAVQANALLSVGKGSSNPPKMVVMEWKGAEEPPIALIGKGICYDSGGINLKASHLVEMKWDKAGAGVIIGVMDILSRLKAPINVIGIAVLAENMPDGNAMKPGDIITSLDGKTIEIIDTDCEGRVALADGITYAQKYHAPKTLIDLGTLTLETFGALGGAYAGLFCPNASLSDQLINAGIATGERLWPMPLGEYFARQIQSKNADLKNVGVPRYGASSAAAEFLRAFVAPDLPWAHLDISGTSWKIDAPEQGVTAFGVELLVHYILGRVG